MNTNIKQAIMDTARQLFNEKGFHNTSMRDIADALQISVGNLTYHYKKKESLIEAIALQDHQGYQKPAPCHTLKDLHQLFQRMAEQRTNRPYYFRHYVQLAQLCPAIYEMQVSVLKDIDSVLTEAFQNLVSAGILKKDFSAQYGGMICAIMTLLIYNVPEFYQGQKPEQTSMMLNCAWCVVFPCLTERGLQEYHLVCS